jgi:4'-phosphopantetheinyl transferase
VDTAWQTASAWPELGGAEVHVWAVALGDARGSLAEHCSVLTDDEARRAETFRQTGHRERAQLTRGILRQLLAQYLAADPRKLELSTGAHGKPLLRHHPLHFNVSHSADCAVFAFTRAGEIGVDIERVRDDMPRQREIAAKYFSAQEAAQLDALPERERNAGFFRCWTRKEAYIKARGDGIFAGLQSFAVSIGPADARLLHSADERACWMAALPEFAGCVGAVAVFANACSLSCWRLEPALLASKK